MIQRILATTALVSVLVAAPAMAQDMNNATGTAPSVENPGVMPGAPMDAQPGVMPGQDMSQPSGTIAPSGLPGITSEVAASSLIGEDVHATGSTEGEHIGKVSDVAMTETGEVNAVIISVDSTADSEGKDVAVPFDQLTWIDQNGESRLMVQMTPQQLNAEPAFDKTSLTGPSVIGELKESAGLTDETAGTTTAMPGAGAAGQAGSTQAAGVNVISTESLIGTSLVTAGGDTAGKISDVVLAPAGKAEAYVVDVGGVLGIGSKPVAVGASNIMIQRDAEGAIQATTSVTPEAIENAPAYTLEAYRQSPETTVIR
ncbi:PRC-barrel domain [Pannonibacter phragmitetus]|uniref:PRC-barrel domain n=2 Tax=Pannonibacter phragmitetus TaxID=121719 RepID=A0A378ZPL6_9HYPH|nr:PRC-barrel domain [Pannonibacter phragmitetus]